MKPTSKIINTFFNKEKNGYTYLIANCEDGSIWKAMYSSHKIGLNDWECIFEAPESKTKEMVANFLLTEEGKIDYFLSNGWEIVSIQPNQNPCPYFIFLIKKYYEKQLTKKEIQIAKQKASLYLDHWNKEDSLFWEEIYKEAQLEFLSEQKA